MPAKILNGFEQKNIQKAASLIQKGEVVAFPTETVYGLGADALNQKAVAKIFAVKNRPFFDPLIVHVANLAWLEKVAFTSHPLCFKLIKKFWPGPLTLVLPKKKKVPYVVTAGQETVAVRMPANFIALSLIQQAQRPIAAPSANLFGHMSPTRAFHVFQQIGQKIKIILDGGNTELGLESTILYLGKKPKILRLGSLPIEEIQKVIGPVSLASLKKEKPQAPGQLLSHYAPFKPLKIVKNEEELIKKIKRGEISEKKIAFLAFSKVKNKKFFTAWQILSPKKDLQEAASHFFEALHNLDNSSAQIIFAEEVPEKMLGRAIMDRLRKAERKN